MEDEEDVCCLATIQHLVKKVDCRLQAEGEGSTFPDFHPHMDDKQLLRREQVRLAAGIQAMIGYIYYLTGWHIHFAAQAQLSFTDRGSPCQVAWC